MTILPTAAGSSGVEAPPIKEHNIPPPILNGQAAASFHPPTILCPNCSKQLHGYAVMCPECQLAFGGVARPDGMPNWAWLCERLVERLTYAEERLRLHQDGAEKAWETVKMHREECDALRRERHEWLQVLNSIPGACGDTTVARAWVERVKHAMEKLNKGGLTIP